MTPDNGIYYQVAYVAAAVVYVTYAITLVLRVRRLNERFESHGDKPTRTE